MHSAVGRGGDEDAGSRFTKILHPERDLALNWTIDVASVLGEYLDELHGAAGSLQDGASLNFVEAALVVQGSAGIYSRKTDYLHSLVLHALTTLTTGETNDSSNDGEDSGDAQGNGSDGDDCDLHRFLLLDDVEVVGSGTDQSRLDMREKDQRKTPEDEDDDEEGGLADAGGGRPYLRAKRKTDGGDWSSRLSDPSVCLTFPLLAGKGRGMILPDIESIIQRAVMRDGKRQRVGVPGRSAEDGGSQKAGSALEPPVGNVFADLEADADEAYGQAHPGGGADGQDGMDIEDDDDGAGGGGDGDSDGENGECEAGMARPRCTPPPGAGPLPGMEWEANVMHPEPPLHESDSAPHAATVEAMRDAHVAEMLQRAAAVQARKSEVETRVGDWQARILPLLEQQDERPPFDIHVYGDLILSALEQKQMQQQQQQQQRRQQQQEEEEMGQREEGQQQEQLCEDLFENVINTPHAYEVPRYFSALLQLVNNGNVSLSVDPDGLVQPSNLSFSHPPSASSSRSSVAPPVRASTSNTSSPPSASVSDPSSGPRCFSRGSSFSVRLHSLNRRQEELRGYVAPSQRQEGGSGAGKARGEGRRKGNRQHGEESQGEEHQWEGSACADAVGEAGGCDYSDGGAGRDGRGRPASRDGCSGLGGGSSKGGSASGRDKKDSAQRKRKARDRELPPLPPASWPPSAVPSSSLSEQEQEWKDSENQGSEGSRMRVVRNGGILTESSKGVNGREVPGAGRNNKSRKVLDENKEEGEVEEEREEQSGDGEEEDEGCGRTERSEVGEMRRCREQEEMLRHHDGKRQKQDGAQETGGGLSGGTSLGGSSLGAHSNGGSSQRCAEAVRGSSAAASVLGEGNASSPVPVARRRDPRGNSLLRKFVAARLERSRSWKERMSFQRIKRKLGTDCVMQPLFSIQQELAETSRFQKRRRESEKADTCAARCSSAQGVNIAGAVVRPERFKRQW
ncbi:hypothetical protein CLOM_g21357 [Closterium sp. NIES-68]|nr:hypothetical protein CLOM_g21357 [Closterium sp. NIES-68]GJP63236.1 hypothetical protein CLOP_g20297 [Closterium sp. NIES-67]